MLAISIMKSSPASATWTQPSVASISYRVVLMCHTSYGLTTSSSDDIHGRLRPRLRRDQVGGAAVGADQRQRGLELTHLFGQRAVAVGLRRTRRGGLGLHPAPA